jgi:hypothetical protein
MPRRAGAARRRSGPGGCAAARTADRNAPWASARLDAAARHGVTDAARARRSLSALWTDFDAIREKY